MKLKPTGGPTNRLRQRVGLLFAVVFLVAVLRWLVQGWLSGTPLPALFLDSRFWLVGLLSLVFFAGLRVPWIRRLEPYVFLVISIIPFFELVDSVYGFGLFAVGSILLLIDGQLSRHPIPKLIALGGLLLTILVVATVFHGAPLEVATGLLLFMSAFFLFLFLAFQDRIIVFVRASRPVVHLSTYGLTEKEALHLLGLLKGQSMKEIAWENGVKESTIRNSLSRAYHRLGFVDKTQLLQWAQSRDVRP